VLLIAMLLPLLATAQAPPPTTCQRQTTAQVVALDQPFFLNRLGAFEATGKMFALKRDVVPISGTTLTAGNVQLRSDKRPRPLVLRMNVGDCLTITFTNLLAPVRHVIGMELTTGIADDGSNVGKNNTPFVAPGGTAIYHLFAQHEGGYVMYSTDTIGGEADGGQQSAGLLGAINVEPPGARWYRSQVTKNDLDAAAPTNFSDGHPNIFYDVVYPLNHPQAGIPVLNMLSSTNEIVKSDHRAARCLGQAGPFSGQHFLQESSAPGPGTAVP
jgi:FtsP/CotA-like multicopper oxidase with cupredoxin domain